LALVPNGVGLRSRRRKQRVHLGSVLDELSDAQLARLVFRIETSRRSFEVASGLLCVTLLAIRRGSLHPVTAGALSAAAPDLEHLFPLLRPGGSKLFHGKRGWHRSGRLPVAAQLLLAGAIVGALAAPTRSPS